MMELVKRLIVAFIVIPPLYLYIRYLPIPYFLGLIMVFASFALYEFYTFCQLPRFFIAVAGLVGVAFYLAVFYYPNHLLDVLVVSVFTIMTVRLFFVKTTDGSINVVARLVLGLFYVFGFAIFIPLTRQRFPVEFTFILFASVWLADGAAYLIGKNFGKHKLYPSVSPNKTIEGAFGGVLGATLATVLLNLIFSMKLEGAKISTIGALIGVASLVGDLIESMFKRDAGVKDSSALIPAHGGFLDKMDSFLVSAPFYYFFLVYTIK